MGRRQHLPTGNLRAEKSLASTASLLAITQSSPIHRAKRPYTYPKDGDSAMFPVTKGRFAAFSELAWSYSWPQRAIRHLPRQSQRTVMRGHACSCAHLPKQCTRPAAHRHARSCMLLRTSAQAVARGFLRVAQRVPKRISVAVNMAPFHSPCVTMQGSRLRVRSNK